MVFCSECGTGLEADARFCANCGTKVVEEGGPPANAAELTSVTGAVRSYTASASQEEKDKKYGQQKWGLFETNYQRNKGISTEESLQEIEEFAGENASARTGGNSTRGTAGFGGSSSSAGQAGGASSFGKSGGASGGGFGGASGGASGGGFGSSSSGPQGPGSGNGKFQDKGPGGANFFTQYQQKEAAKYKPGAGNKLV